MALTNIFGLIRSIVRQTRANEAEVDWTIFEAAVSKFEIQPDLDRIRPVLVFSYVIKGETFYGSCIGYPTNSASRETLQLAMMAINALHIRFDPADPGMSRVLNPDNPELPFEIDHDPY